MKNLAVIIGFLSVHAVAVTGAPAETGAETERATKSIALSRLTSPVIFAGNRKHAFRDPAVVYHEGEFFLYFTLVERDRDGGCHWFLAMSRSADLLTWSKPINLSPRDRRLNYCALGNVTRSGDDWIVCYQTYPTPKREIYGDKTSRIFIARSKDLLNWSKPELLRVKGEYVERASMGRMIDPFLIEDADDPGKWWCFYKQDGVGMSWSYDLKHWNYVGRQNAGENVSVIRQGDEYVMFHAPANGIGIKRSKHLSQWGADEKLLVLSAGLILTLGRRGARRRP